MRTYPQHRSSLGLDANIVVAIVWFGGALLSALELGALSIFVPIIIFFVEKDSHLVKFHAIQAITLMIFTVIATIVLTVSIIGILLIPLLTLILFLVSIVAVVRGWKYQTYELPYVQPIAQWLAKILNFNLNP